MMIMMDQLEAAHSDRHFAVGAPRPSFYYVAAAGEALVASVTVPVTVLRLSGRHSDCGS